MKLRPIPKAANDRTNVLTISTPEYVVWDASYIDGYISSCIFNINEIIPTRPLNYKPLLFLIEWWIKDEN